MNVFLFDLAKCPVPLPVSSTHQCDVYGVCSLLSPSDLFCCPPSRAMWPLHGDFLVWYHRVAWGPWNITLLQDIYHFQLRYSGPQICVFFYPFLVTRSGVWLLVGQKPVKRQVWWKVCFILDAGNWSGGGQTPVQRWTLSLAPAIPTDNQWTRAFIDRGRGLHLETLLTVILKLVSSDPTSVILIKYSQSSVPGSVCSQLPEASSWNSGSWCHGYSLSSCS